MNNDYLVRLVSTYGMKNDSAVFRGAHIFIGADEGGIYDANMLKYKLEREFWNGGCWIYFVPNIVFGGILYGFCYITITQ